MQLLAAKAFETKIENEVRFIRAEGHVSSFGECANGAFIVKHDDKIGDLRTNLRPKTGAAGTDE